MTNQLLIVLLIAASVGSGVMGGLFFVFSNTIMSAFDRLPNGGGVPAMQRINEVILNPLFFFVFFGTGIVSVVLLIFYVTHLSQPGALLACIGAVVYIVGAIGVTMACNVPLNNKLAAVPASAKDLAAHWQAYRGPWTHWNHVRTITCTLAAAAFALSARF
ncbi:MAG: anthrone oxygenase family protein [Steroidobacter sp.]